jgi:hypothetical protein
MSGAVDPLVQAHQYMDHTYPGWRRRLVAMAYAAEQGIRDGCYRPRYRDDASAYREPLTILYDELYLRVSNATPHKPPLGAKGA